MRCSNVGLCGGPEHVSPDPSDSVSAKNECCRGKIQSNAGRFDHPIFPDASTWEELQTYLEGRGAQPLEIG